MRHDRNDSAGTQRSGQSSQSFSSGDAGVALALRPPNNSQYSHGTGQGLMNSRRVRFNPLISLNISSPVLMSQIGIP